MTSKIGAIEIYNEISGPCYEKYERISPCVIVFDRTKDRSTALFDFKYGDAEISCIKFGPYDNGHIVVGLSNGVFTILDSISLNKLLEVSDIFNQPSTISEIVFDPTNLIIITSD